jgi:hypothetical protein
MVEELVPALGSMSFGGIADIVCCIAVGGESIEDQAEAYLEGPERKEIVLRGSAFHAAKNRFETGQKSMEWPFFRGRLFNGSGRNGCSWAGFASVGGYLAKKLIDGGGGR